jgi:hypothetical protein
MVEENKVTDDMPTPDPQEFPVAAPDNEVDEEPPSKKPCLDSVPTEHASPEHASPEHASPEHASPEHASPDHASPDHESPRKKIRELNKREKKITSLKKKLKMSQQKFRRLNKKVKSLGQIIKQLRQDNLISSNCEEMLSQTFSGVPLALMKRVSAKKSGKRSKYTPEMKSFALTLQFYSAKAYEFVRKTFNIALPSQSQIRRWYGKVQADPGFTQPAFNALKVKVEDAEKNGKKVICSLMMDEMAIKKHISWDGKKYNGYVDLGNGINDDSLPVAADALVFMVVSVDGSWKVPCGYFFVNGLSGEERANLVKVCIQRLTDTGIKVISLTCDGPACHFSMLSSLGACLDPSKMIPYFPHPQNKNENLGFS